MFTSFHERLFAGRDRITAEPARGGYRVKYLGRVWEERTDDREKAGGFESGVLTKENRSGSSDRTLPRFGEKLRPFVILVTVTQREE